MRCLFLAFFFFFISNRFTFATHVRAGDLTSERVGIDNLTYRIRVILYRDTDGVGAKPSIISFGDGTPEALVTHKSLGVINNGTTEVLVYETIHTFASAGIYKVSFLEQNRNEGIRNITNSVDNAFYIESEFFVNPFLGQNSSPRLLIPPVDEATIGQRFIHNPGAFDTDGDSLSYRIVICLQAPDIPVQNYNFPNATAFSNAQENGNTPAIFTINSRTGDLVWDAPSLPGEYNVAFYVEEWRDGIQIGLVNRDMQILVIDGNNRRPNLIIPKDTCVVAGSTLIETVRAVDPDDDQIVLSAAGDLFNPEGHNNLASFPVILGNSPITGTFIWRTQCTDVRARSYQVIFRAADAPGNNNPSLVDIQTWQIRVIGPAPDILKVESQTEDPRNINLTWTDYTCQNADKMTIWRRRGSFNFEPSGCITGLPAFTGYEMIGSTSISQSNYVDVGLQLGNTYCYRLVATFPFPEQGESYASEEVCIFLPGNLPLITNVDVLKTDADSGQILVRWTPPYFVDSLMFPPPYAYQLLRSEGLIPGTLTQITSTTDTFFIDNDLNTLELPYNYRVILLANNNTTDTSSFASSVRLEGLGSLISTNLNWQANVPWSIATERFPYHYISIERNGSFQIIDSVLVSTEGFTYTDFNNGQGFQFGTSYRYKVKTEGTYQNVLIPEPLINNSQIISIQPLDTIPPCAVINISVDSFFNFSCDQVTTKSDYTDACTFQPVSNRLSWGMDRGDSCQEDVNQFYIYRSLHDDDELVLIDSVPSTQTTYLHSNLSSAAGCYVITTVDVNRNESVNNTKICVDNCVYYELPNSFTPSQNINSLNNTFIPFRCPRFVQNVQFKVFNRWDQMVYQSSEDIDLNWDGKDSKGNDLPAGVYYYTIEVKFIRLSIEDEKQIFRGWINLIR